LDKGGKSMDYGHYAFKQNPLRSVYYPIYEDLYTKHSSGMPEPKEAELADRTREVIEGVIAAKGFSDKMRPDAKLFLLSNLHQSFVTPLVKAQKLSEDEILGYLHSDTETILRKAEKIAVERAEGQEDAVVSGHIALDALSQSWDEMDLAKPEIWGHEPSPSEPPY
jgi:hypothetical protein